MVEADYCDVCGEAVMGRAAGDRYGSLVLAFQKQVNSGLVDPAYIAQVRTKLQLGKKEAAEIFGGGVNAFTRYESGKSRPPVALVKLLKVLDHHPELLAEVRA
jgi:HTH-type transcriptional regulator/antitoxin MqsA